MKEMENHTQSWFDSQTRWHWKKKHIDKITNKYTDSKRFKWIYVEDDDEKQNTININNKKLI